MLKHAYLLYVIFAQVLSYFAQVPRQWKAKIRKPARQMIFIFKI